MFKTVLVVSAVVDCKRRSVKVSLSQGMILMRVRRQALFYNGFITHHTAPFSCEHTLGRAAGKVSKKDHLNNDFIKEIQEKGVIKTFLYTETTSKKDIL